MNQAIKDKIEKLIEQIRDNIEAKETTFDDRSERWQFSERGMAFEEKINELEEVLLSLEEALSHLDIFLDD